MAIRADSSRVYGPRGRYGRPQRRCSAPTRAYRRDVRARHGVEVGQLAPTFHAPVQADPRVAIDMRHTGLGCRLSPLCGTFATTMEQRAAHELGTHDRVARPDPVAASLRYSPAYKREVERAYRERKRARGAG